MITKILMPKLNMSMTTGLVSHWYKKVGDSVTEGEVICEIEGDKASIEIEAPSNGNLLKIIISEGKEAPVLTSIGLIGKTGDNIQSFLAEEQQKALIQETSIKEPTSVHARQVVEPDAVERINASPVAKRLAQELGVDLHQVTGTGPDNLIDRNDVLEFSKKQNLLQPTAPAVKKIVTLSGIKKVSADRIKQSYQEIPQFSLAISANMTNVMELLKSRSEEVHITISDVLISAVAHTLNKHILLNSTIEGDQINIFSDINIGYAINTDKGLVVPVIRKADRMSLPEISNRRQELTKFALDGKLSMDDISSGTFTISNLGMLEIEEFKPIVNPGQAAILGVGKAMPVAVFGKDGKVIKSFQMRLTLVSDHRIVDGAIGANFLKDLKNHLKLVKNI